MVLVLCTPSYNCLNLYQNLLTCLQLFSSSEQTQYLYSELQRGIIPITMLVDLMFMSFCASADAALYSYKHF